VRAGDVARQGCLDGLMDRWIGDLSRSSEQRQSKRQIGKRETCLRLTSAVASYGRQAK
jgi:hypothetical protein